MNNGNSRLQSEVRRAWPADAAPPFDGTWQAARDRHASGRRQYRWLASAAALVAAVVIAFNVQAPAEHSYIEVAELLDSTYWSAPSDVLLPDRSFDIYQDLPVIFESTEPAEGALL